MEYTILLILALLQVKHWYIDFVNQSMEEVENKGKYGQWLGIKHSVKQGIGTVICFIPFCTLEWSITAGLIDFVLHYHIDWTKMNKGNRDITTPQFWNHLGLDQMAHQLTYIGLIALTLL